MSETLSQEEIDALLNGAFQAQENEENNGLTADVSLEKNPDIDFTETDIDVLGEIANISMGTAATTLSLLVNRKVQITTPTVTLLSKAQVNEKYPEEAVIVDVKYKLGITGSNILVLTKRDGAVIVDLMMGGSGDPTSFDLTDMQLSGVSEAMNQMMGSSATSMSQVFNATVDITPPHVIVDKLMSTPSLQDSPSDYYVCIDFQLIIPDNVDSKLLQVIPFDVAKGMVNNLLAATAKTKANPIQAESVAPAPTSLEIKPIPVKVEQPVFRNFDKELENNIAVKNLDLILDVPLQVSVELGKSKKTIKDILSISLGSIIELNRVAGEPVDLFVNGKLIARCEVVVINESYGIRITDIINREHRI